MESIELENNTMGYIVLFICVVLFLVACLSLYYRWVDKIHTRYICDECEYVKNDKFCKHCGTHEYEKQLIK